MIDKKQEKMEEKNGWEKVFVCLSNTRLCLHLLYQEHKEIPIVSLRSLCCNNIFDLHIGFVSIAAEAVKMKKCVLKCLITMRAAYALKKTKKNTKKEKKE